MGDNYEECCTYSSKKLQNCIQLTINISCRRLCTEGTLLYCGGAAKLLCMVKGGRCAPLCMYTFDPKKTGARSAREYSAAKIRYFNRRSKVFFLILNAHAENLI